MYVVVEQTDGFSPKAVLFQHLDLARIYIVKRVQSFGRMEETCITDRLKIENRVETDRYTASLLPVDDGLEPTLYPDCLYCEHCVEVGILARDPMNRLRKRSGWRCSELNRFLFARWNDETMPPVPTDCPLRGVQRRVADDRHP